MIPIHRVVLSVCLSILLCSEMARGLEVLAEVAKLDPADPTHSDLGFSVSHHGEVAAVGAPNTFDSDFPGSLYIFERSMEGEWLQVAKLTAEDAEIGDLFGHAVSVHGERVVASAIVHGDNGFASGAAYVFERDPGGSWQEVAKVLPDDGAAGDRFGYAVSLHGDRLAVSALGDDDQGPASGSVYLFERDGNGSWTEVAKLLPDGGGPFDLFGFSTALEGDRVAAGALLSDAGGTNSGSVVVFERDGAGTWLEVAELVGPDAQPSDRSGASVAIDGDRIAYGADGDDDNGSDSGSAYVFERQPNGAWTAVAKLLANDGAENDRFGFSITIEGDSMVVGAASHDVEETNAGAAYLFERQPDGTWPLSEKLLAFDRDFFDGFGTAVSLSDQRLWVGAPDDLDGTGFAYVFEYVLVEPTLAVAGSCPGAAELQVGGSTPRSMVAIYGAADLGSDPVPGGSCAGVLLDLQNPLLASVVPTDFDGNATLTPELGEALCGFRVQIVDEKSCLTSNAAQIPAPER